MNGLLRDRVTIKRAVEATSASREVTNTWPDLAVNVRASVQPRSGYFRQREQGKETSSEYRAFFAKGTDVRAGDRVVAGGVTYLVTFVADYFAHHIEADLSRVVNV